MKKGNSLLNLILVVLMGALSIIEIAIEVVYQIVRLIRRAYGVIMNWILRKIKNYYTGNIKFKRISKKDKDDDIQILEFHYD